MEEEAGFQEVVVVVVVLVPLSTVRQGDEMEEEKGNGLGGRLRLWLLGLAGVLVLAGWVDGCGLSQNSGLTWGRGSWLPHLG